MFVICFVGSVVVNDHGEFCVLLLLLLLPLSAIMIRILCVSFMHLLFALLEMPSLYWLLVNFCVLLLLECDIISLYWKMIKVLMDIG